MERWKKSSAKISSQMVAFKGDDDDDTGWFIGILKI